MLWKDGNIEMRIWPLDHCPPHVTAVCRADNWTARFEFSMVTDDVSLLDVKPLSNAPDKKLIRYLGGDVLANRMLCRREWWRFHQDACLHNKPVTGSPGGQIALCDPATTQPAGLIVAGTGIYIAGHGVRAMVDWGNGITVELLKEV
jgi:hypothetical protein